MTQLKTRQAGALSPGEGGSAAKIYKDGLYGDTELVFDIRIDKAAADWPSVTFRNQSYTEDFAGKNSAAYIFCIHAGQYRIFTTVTNFNGGNKNGSQFTTRQYSEN